jgi:hypothetical protein
MGRPKKTCPLVILDFFVFNMLEFGLVWQGVVLAAASERGLLDREELAGEFLVPLSSPQGRQGPDRKGQSHEKEHISFYEMNG